MSSIPPPKWTLSSTAFERLLDALDGDRERAGLEYEDLRRKLVDFFDWRGSATPDVQADETLDRVARKLQQGEVVTNLKSYVYAVARMVFHEAQRRGYREAAAWNLLGREAAAAALTPGPQTEGRVACLKRCLQRLPEDGRRLIMEYYLGEGRVHLSERKALAARLGLTYGALKTRAHRLRGLLDECLRRCLEREE